MYSALIINNSRYLMKKFSKIMHDYEMSVSRIVSNVPINIRMKILGIPSTEELLVEDSEKDLRNK